MNEFISVCVFGGCIIVLLVCAIAIIKANIKLFKRLKDLRS